MVYPFPQEPP